MKIELTEEEAQKVINSQRKQIGELKGRLVRAHVASKYFEQKSVHLTRAMIEGAIRNLKGLIESDAGNEYDQYDHEAINEQIAKYEAFFASSDWHDHRGIRVSPVSYEYLYIAMDYNDRTTRHYVGMFETMQGYLWREGEPETPDHFSSDGVNF